MIWSESIVISIKGSKVNTTKRSDEMKLDKLLQVRKVLGDHANEPVPTMLAYKILKFMKGSDTESAFYDQKLKEIIEKYYQSNCHNRCILINGFIEYTKKQRIIRCFLHCI